MRDLIEALLTLLSYIAMGMLWLAFFGSIFIMSVALAGDTAMMESKVFYAVAAYTLIVFSVFIIWLVVETRR